MTLHQLCNSHAIEVALQAHSTGVWKAFLIRGLGGMLYDKESGWNWDIEIPPGADPSDALENLVAFMRGRSFSETDYGTAVWIEVPADLVLK